MNSTADLKCISSADLKCISSSLSSNCLTSDVKKELQEKFEKLIYSPYFETECFLSEAYDIVRRVLPDNIFNNILSLKRDLYSQGSLLIKNLPLDQDLGSTPGSYHSYNKKTFLSEACLVGFGQILGEIYGYKNEKNGELIHNICPEATQKSIVSSSGSNVALPLHTEDVHLFPYSPTFVCLYCLRDGVSSTAFTYVLDVKNIISDLKEDTIRILERPIFYVDQPKSFGGLSQRSSLMPVIRGDRLLPDATTEFTDMRGISSVANKALDIFKDACERSTYLKKVALRPGELLILDNRKVIHGRSAYQADFGGEGRWCQRTFVKLGDLWEWRDKLLEYRILNL